MAIKTFTAGEVLTAADTNTYLANSGLVYVTSATIGSGVASVTVTGAFNSTYDNYKIVLSGGVTSASTNLALTLGASTASYYSNLNYVAYGGAGVLFVTSSNGSSWTYAGSGSTTNINASIELLTPFLAKTTGISSFYTENATSGSSGTFTGFHNSAVSYSSLTFTAGTGTMTGGTITVYGYRKA